VVRQLLTFSRKSPDRHHPVDLAPVIEESLRLLRSTLPTSIAFAQDLQTGLPAVNADPTQIHQVMINLCTNAADAMISRGGTLGVSLDRALLTGSEEPKTAGSRPGSFVRLTVSDTGEGIDPSIKDRIFDPYFTTKATGKGTGLGLAVTHGVLESHGGFIRVSSTPGQGTVLELFFPAADSPAVAGTREEFADVPPGTESILFIDDEPSLTELNRLRLQRLGYRVTPETNPVSALETFRSSPERFDLVVTDMTMPGMTGDLLARKILLIRPEMPIILYTGYSEKISDSQSAETGIRLILEKPVDLPTLARAIRRILEKDTP
jgi:CheY-like chemotaxis protein